MRRYKHFLIGTIIFLGIGIYAPSLLASTLGNSVPFNWAGNGARVNFYDEFGNPMDPPPALITTTNVNETTSTYYEDETMGAWAESSAYVLKGSVGNSKNTEWQAGGYFRDELYFETYNGQPAELALTFSIEASGEVYEPWGDTLETGHAWLNISMNVPIDSEPSGWIYLSQQTLLYQTTADSFSINSQVTLKSTDWDSQNLVGSGTYLPLSISLWGTANNAYLNWGDTVQLVNVQVFQKGVALDDSQFTILSNNGESYFSAFEHTTVPIPGALWLLGSGLAGIIGIRRKGNKKG
jgi:hypothetical protein